MKFAKMEKLQFFLL